MSDPIARDFVNAHPELQELARQWAEQKRPLSEEGFRPLFPFVEKLLRTVFVNEGVPIKPGETLIPLLQLCCSDRLRFFNLPGMCCDARSRERISIMRAAVVHGDYTRDMNELVAGNWTGTEADYQKLIPHRLWSLFYALDHIAKQVDHQTGKFRRTWELGRSLCDSCKAGGLTI